MPPQRARTNSREEFIQSPLPGPVTGNIAGPSGTTASPILQNSQVHQLNSQGLAGLRNQSRSNSDPSVNENHSSASPPMNRFSEALTPANYNSRIQQQQQSRQQKQQQNTQREVLRVSSQSPDQRLSSMVQPQVVSSSSLTKELSGDQKRIEASPHTLQEPISQRRELQHHQQLQQAPYPHYRTEIVQRNEIDLRGPSRNDSNTPFNPNFAAPGDDFGLTPLQLQRLKTNNKETLKEMCNQAMPDIMLKEDQMTLLERRILDRFPDSILLPGYPVIPRGYVPLMMSPQGLLVPMKFEQFDIQRPQPVLAFTPIWKESLAANLSNNFIEPSDSPHKKKQTNNINDSASIPGSRISKKRDRIFQTIPDAFPRSKRENSVESASEGNLHTEDSIGPLTPSKRKADHDLDEYNTPRSEISSKIHITAEMKAGALRLCMISEEFFEKLKRGTVDVEDTENPMQIKYRNMIDKYDALTNPQFYNLSNYSAIKNSYNEQLKLVPTSEHEPDAKFLHGLEKDLVERKDFELVRNELSRNYLREKIHNSFMDESLEKYSQICLDYSMRLLKFKKFLMNQKDLLQKGKGQLYLVESSKSERLWRLFLNDSVQCARPSIVKKRTMRSMESENDSDYSSSAVSSSGTSTSRVGGIHTSDIRSLTEHTHRSRKRRQKKNIKNVNTVPVLDGLCPILKDDEFSTLTNARSKAFENSISKSSNPEVSSQADFEELIEFYNYKSVLHKLMRTQVGNNSGNFSTQRSMFRSRKLIRDIQLEEGRQSDSSDVLSSDEKRSKNRAGSKKSLLQLADAVAAATGGVDSTTNMIDIERSQLLLNDRELSNCFTKVYSSPVGLTDAEIDDDLKSIWNTDYD
ncbi:unnamed protein product [Ambrosiozyma monospora]|uniref:Unnamed protein product n=1 Tax=Ambrosiozyma monospora TaxID=43982 RepID=A0ACB5SYD9_AMBMO|nr:unnamed protein product [Ambrosiozyma monospora]